jgi:hypothetical protein
MVDSERKLVQAPGVDEERKQARAGLTAITAAAYIPVRVTDEGDETMIVVGRARSEDRRDGARIASGAGPPPEEPGARSTLS